MKKFLLILTMVCSVISIICSWFKGNFLYSLIFTAAMILLIKFAKYLLKRRNSARLGIIVIVSFASVFCASSNIGFVLYKRTSNVEKPIKTETAITTNIPENTQTDSDFEKDMEVDSAEEIDYDEDVEDKDIDNEVITLEEDENENNDDNEKVTEKIVEKRVEVPVEVIVEKVVKEYVEVPVVEYVEIDTTTKENSKDENSTIYNQPTYNYSYTGDPTIGNYGYGNTGDPTIGGYNYNYDYIYSYGDPTLNNNSYYNSITISGSKSVELGECIKYTISGVNGISKNRLNIPYGVSIDKISGNNVYLTFDEVGIYSIGYDSVVINVKVKAE